MEIYNFHTDTRDESVSPQIFNFIVNGKKYRHWALRQMFDEQTNILALWDSLNTKRKIVGFSAADTLSVPSLIRHLKLGHLYTAFKSLGDASGFMYYSKDQNDSIYGIMGDSIMLEEVKSLNAVSPLPGQFRLIHDGKTINISSGEIYQYSWAEVLEKGAYRIEVHLKLRGKHVPWIYSNPVYIN